MAQKRPTIDEVIDRLGAIESAEGTYCPRETLPSTKTYVPPKKKNRFLIVVTAVLIFAIGGIIAAHQYGLFNKEYDNPTTKFQIRDRIIEVAIPESVEELLKEGDNFLAVNRYDDAIDRFKEAFVQEPRDPTICWRIALAYDRKEKRQQAINWIRKAIDLDADNRYPHYRRTLGDLEE